MNKISKILKEIDMDDTLYNNASEKYHAIAEFMNEKMNGANIYPYGSFAIGTTTKPYRNGKDCSYDIDLVLEVERDKNRTNGKKLMLEAYDILKADGRYSDKIEKYEKCITIHYAEVNGVEFNLDIIPSVKEDEISKQELLDMGGQEKYINDAIAISSLNLEDKEGWYTAVPKGYKRWFDEINLPYKINLYKILQRDKDGKIIYESIEDVPRYKLKTNLQSTIQIIKRVRDIHYSKIGKENLKPISAIITTLVLNIAARNLDYNLSLEDFLIKVLDEIEKYDYYNVMSEGEFRNLYSTFRDITKENGKWKMINPVNPKDNLVDSWNNNSEISKLFFEWIKSLRLEVKEMLESNKMYGFENLFGTEVSRRAFNLPNHIETEKGPKPYGNV